MSNSRANFPVHDVDSIWTVLEQKSERASAPLVAAPTGLIVSAGEVLIGLDVSGNRHLLVPLLAGEAFAPDVSGESLHLSRVDQAGVAYLSAICLSRSLDEVFAKFSRELLESLVGVASAATKASKAFQDWKELFSDGRRDGLLSLDEQVGLFGELTLLRELVSLDPHRSTALWTGPDRSQHDFRSPSFAMEVKASRAREGRRMSISSVEQLNAPKGAQPYLVYFRVRMSPQSENLSDLVAQIEQLGVNKTIFHRQLRQSGFRIEDARHYADNRFHVLERSLFDVLSEGFPRIVPESFTIGTVPPGTERLSYTIDLSNMPPYPETDETYSRIIREMITDK